MGVSKHIIWIICGFKTVNNGKQLGWPWGSLEWPRDLDRHILYEKFVNWLERLCPTLYLSEVDKAEYV